jgi:hypothetical protein
MNKSKRQFYLKMAFSCGNAEIVRQAISCRKLFGVGLLLLIHGKTTTLLMNPDTMRPRRGLFKVQPSQSGNCLDEVLCYGFMGSVSFCPAVILSLRLMNAMFCSGCREERVLVR